MSTSLAPSVPGPVSMNVPFLATSAARVRHVLEDWLAEQGYGSQVVEDARLIVTELVGNAVRHGQRGPARAPAAGWDRAGPVARCGP